MAEKKLAEALGRLSVETGSLACMGCGWEHDCGVHGCAILKRAKEELERLKKVNEHLGRELGAALNDLRSLDNCAVCGWNDAGACRAPKNLMNCFAWRGAERARLWEG